MTADSEEIHVSRRPNKPARLYQQVVEKLARAISAETYKIGDRLPAERDLAAAYSVSRPTVREAIIALEMEGLVEVRVGSGVYVLARPGAGHAQIKLDIGAFELTEARLLIEGDVAALAATVITDAELDGLDDLLGQMDAANRKASVSDVELIDRRFHLAIAEATHNGAMVSVVDLLWTIRNRSPQCVRIFDKSRAKGTRPVVNEHSAIVAALRARDSVAARAAMRDHLGQVLNYLLDATEVEAIEETRARMAAQRTRYSIGHSV